MCWQIPNLCHLYRFFLKALTSQWALHIMSSDRNIFALVLQLGTSASYSLQHKWSLFSSNCLIHNPKGILHFFHISTIYLSLFYQAKKYSASIKSVPVYISNPSSSCISRATVLGQTIINSSLDYHISFTSGLNIFIISLSNLLCAQSSESSLHV